MKESLTRSEVAKHKTEEDCWFIIDHKIYDLSDFVDAHPVCICIYDLAAQSLTVVVNREVQSSLHNTQDKMPQQPSTTSIATKYCNATATCVSGLSRERSLKSLILNPETCPKCLMQSRYG